MVELACALSNRGHDIEMFVYHPQYDFFGARLEEHAIRIHRVSQGRGFSLTVLRKLRSVAQSGVDVVLSYQNSANIYAELSKGFSRRPKLVVSERTSYIDDRSRASALTRRLLHACADHVVTNSQSQCAWLMRYPWLRNKVSCIYNGVDSQDYPSEPLIPAAGERLRLLAIGRVGVEKNVDSLIHALRLVAKEGSVPLVNWAGPKVEGDPYVKRVDELLRNSPEVHEHWRWLGVRDDVPELLASHHALVHPSLYEGLPNAVCEALAAARPVLLSDTCDHPLLTGNGKRGFLFDPKDPQSMAEAIRSLMNLAPSAWHDMGLSGREYATLNLSLDKMAVEYETLFRCVVDPAAAPA